ncbi:hypothetical protein [Enterobacter kobei]|uniref:hypothetical protein n=1 Tax=Enterobacter kobei TaxID=208224 RepID=UPI002FD03773
MSTITKQWLQQTIADMEEHRDLFPGDLDDNHGKVLAALRIALASLEAEPVSVNDDMAYAFHHAMSDSSLGTDEVEEIKAGLRAALANVAAPPAPVSVPDEATPENIEILASTFAPRGVTYQWDKDECNAAADSWNACRAAMLQGADGNSPVIPDGWVLVPVELTGAMTNAMTDAILDDLHNVDVWRSVLAAAPQQGVR